MKKFAAAAFLAVILLSGCGNTDETYRPESYSYASGQKESEFHSEISKPAAAYASVSSAESSPQSAGISVSAVPAPDSDRSLKQSFTSDNGKLMFTVENIFSDGEYYTVTASAEKNDSESQNTVYINGEPYKTPVLTLLKEGKQLDLTELSIPDGDRFLTLESAADNYSYGSEIISNMRDFNAAEYPDMLGLVFRSGAEAAVPEYARYFTVFGGKLAELPIYENGSKVRPRGTKLEPASAGTAKQFLTVMKSNGGGYEIIKYEYRFDLENKRLNRQQVRFYGWEY